jgi:sugar lactone lactonase YvrE
VFFPPPPDTARIQFLARFSGADDFKGGTSFLDRVVGKKDEIEPAIQKAWGVSIHRGRIYVCDQRLPGFGVFDLAEGAFRQIQPADMGTLQRPASCTVDPSDGRVYVTDVGRKEVVVFDSTLSYDTSFGAGNGIIPTDVSVDGDLVWVSDIGNGKVRAYRKDSFELVREFPERKLGEPAHIFATDGRVYVSEGLRFQVSVYDLEGELLQKFGEVGRGPGQFARPKGITVDRDGRIYVVDAAFQNVQLFNAEGQLLTFFGGPYKGPGFLAMPAKVVVDYDNLEYFQQYVDPRFTLKHLILVTNQFGPDKVTVYGFVEHRENEGEAK